MTTLPLRVAILLLFLALAGGMGRAYIMRTQLSLNELASKADVVFKAEAVSNSAGLDPNSGATVTQFRIISMIKGPNPGETVKFQHLDEVKVAQFAFGPPPIHYHFEPGKSYVVFAKATETPGVYEPLWQKPISMGNQGMFPCASDQPVTGANLKDNIWAELTGLLKQSENTNILSAITQLDQMSGEGSGEKNPGLRFDSTFDFDRKPVLDALHGFIASNDPKIAQAAISAVGSHNPYMTQERAAFWLATVGSGEVDGLTKMDAKMVNLGGGLYTNDLLAAAEKAPDDATRALAIRALGLVRKPDIGQHMIKLLNDPLPAIRAAAIVVLADYPDLSTSPQLSRMGVDPAVEVRIAVAQCIGFGQNKAGLELLSRMLTDPELNVRKAAAQSLLSFSAKDTAVAHIFKANLKTDFAPVFVIALARIDAAPYLDDLLKVMQTYTMDGPTMDWWWGGTLPAGDARNVLFKYLRTIPDDKLQAGQFDRYLDAMDKGALGNMGLGNSFEVYAFEIRHGLTARAQALRQAAMKAFPFQQAISYDQARDHPEIYDQ